MNFERLQKNICDNILEAQIKLGYEGRPVSLNYTTASVNHLMGTALSESEMESALAEFAEYSADKLGNIAFHPIKTGYCITVAEKGTEYIHNSLSDDCFIKEFIEAVRNHCTLEEVFDVFHKHSKNVCIEELHNDEFDYLVYFEDGNPDDYRYCISAEEEIDGSIHITYHRFIIEDYIDFDF